MLMLIDIRRFFLALLPLGFVLATGCSTSPDPGALQSDSADTSVQGSDVPNAPDDVNSAGANPADNAASNPQDDGRLIIRWARARCAWDENLDEEDPSDSNQNLDPDLDPGSSAEAPDEGNELDPTDSQQEDENGLKRVILGTKWLR